MKHGMKREPNAFRQLHKSIKKWAKKNKHDWRVEATTNGYKYYLNDVRISSSHPNEWIPNALKAAFNRAGIPKDVIGLELTEQSWQHKATHLCWADLDEGTTERDERVGDDIKNAQVGQQVWFRGHQVLVVKRIEHPELTNTCNDCKGEGESMHVYLDDYDEEIVEEVMERCYCTRTKYWLEFCPDGSTVRYSITG
jgi:hypothetical protein